VLFAVLLFAPVLRAGVLVAVEVSVAVGEAGAVVESVDDGVGVGVVGAVVGVGVVGAVVGVGVVGTGGVGVGVVAVGIGVGPDGTEDSQSG
jgi:hypothetical protein